MSALETQGLRMWISYRKQYLPRKFVHVLPDKLVTGGMEQCRKTPRIPKSYEMRFPSIEVNVQHSELDYLLSGQG